MPLLFSDRIRRWWQAFRASLNFYRIHLLFFMITPLFFSAIFYASNGRYHIDYIDALFNCVSAMTVCGLATVDLSSLTPWQQIILFVQMCLGSPVVVSWVMVYTRRYYFEKKFEHIVRAQISRREAEKNRRTLHGVPMRGRLASFFVREPGLSTVREDSETTDKQPADTLRLRPEMIRRTNRTPQLVDPSGLITEGPGTFLSKSATGAADSNDTEGSGVPLVIGDTISSSPKRSDVPLPQVDVGLEQDHAPEGRVHDMSAASDTEPSPNSHPLQVFQTIHPDSHVQSPPTMARAPTIEFAPQTAHSSATSPHRRYVSVGRGRHRRPLPDDNDIDIPTRIDERMPTRSISRRSSLPSHTAPARSVPGQSRPPIPTENDEFGGFPMPHKLLAALFSRLFPKVREGLRRTLTVPLTTTLNSQGDHTADTKSAPYISFHAVVGRNSVFYSLTDEQSDELGGVEYRALNALLWLLAVYHIGIQLFAFMIIAPYISTPRWKTIFVPPFQHRVVSPVWFSLFQTVSAYTNTGMSLVDQSMLPFQTACLMIVLIIFLILAGNTAFPVFLRFMIWMISKLTPTKSRANETLHFLLDHPRRCFIYLFPSHQTWFLFTVVVALNFTDWFFFLVLDIGNPVIEMIPLGTRLIDGLLQAVAVRASGFAVVPLAAVAPAVKVLYVIMMYISVYPIAMSVRTTNVYEEQSLGIFEEDGETQGESDFQPVGSRVAVWSRYLAMHARKQLAFDMWWLAMALFLICIVEQHHLNDVEKQGWFSIFTILFELVSAYGSIGLTLGIPTQNFSLSGAFRPLSKLIVCVVMIRGRHRGLPVAIDRAVMLPSEYGARELRENGARSPVIPDASSEHRRQTVQGGNSDELPAEETTRGSAQERVWGSDASEFVYSVAPRGDLLVSGRVPRDFAHVYK